MVKRSTQFRLLLCLVVLLFSIASVSSHQGGKDALGCHTCRTNCERWEIPYGFYHHHNPTRACFDTLQNVDSEPENPQPPPSPPQPPPSPPQPNSSSTLLPSLLVRRVIDGDTFVLRSGERVRLIGIDTAERGQCYYRQAKNELRDLILFQEVQLERDISDTDRYGRLLRYVYVDGVFVNEELVKDGHAKAKRYKPDVKFSKRFADLESLAKAEKSGLWGKCQTVSVQQGESATATPIPQASIPQLTEAVYPPYAARPEPSTDYYTNAYGQEVQSPTYYPYVPEGASALCRDGTYSFSKTRRGTCSHHGGVAMWL